MFNKTIFKTVKVTFGVIAMAAFLGACSSTSTTDSTGTASTTTPATTTTGSTQTTVSEIVAPTETAFYFDFDSAVLRADSRALLTAHAAVLKASPRSVRLEGHADERGTSEGVTSDIEVVSYGEERPAADASNEYSWQLNRRVEIK